MCCNSSCCSAINLAGILHTMTNAVINFFPTKGRNNHNSVIIMLLAHWSSDEEQAVSAGPKSGAPPLPFAWRLKQIQFPIFVLFFWLLKTDKVQKRCAYVMWRFHVISLNYWRNPVFNSCPSWGMNNQLDVTCYFISIIMRSTCFGH